MKDHCSRMMAFVKRNTLYPTILFASIVIGFTSNLYGALASDIQESFSLSVVDVGSILSFAQLGTFLSFLCYPFLEHRFGVYRMMVVGILGNAFSYFLMAFASSGTWFAFGFFLSGTLGYPFQSAKATVTVLADPPHADRNISGVHLTYGCASIIAGFLIALIKGSRWAVAYVAFASVWILTAMLFSFLYPKVKEIPGMTVEKGKRERGHNFSLLSHGSSACFFIYVIITASVEGLTVIYPLLYVEHELSATGKEVGYVMSCFFVGLTVARLLLIPIVSKTRHPWVVSGLLASFAALGLFAFAFSPSLLGAAVSMLLIGLATGDINPMANIIEIHVWKDDIDQMMNLHNISPTIGRFLMPFVVSFFIAHYSERAGIVAIAVMMASSILFLFLSNNFLVREKRA